MLRVDCTSQLWYSQKQTAVWTWPVVGNSIIDGDDILLEMQHVYIFLQGGNIGFLFLDT